MRHFSKYIEQEKWAIFIFCLILHLWNIGADLPAVYSPDEPHWLNMAAYFSAGHLRPYDFKYPSLWIYLIALVFAFLFSASKYLGVISSTKQFAFFFLTRPTIYYLSVRLLSAVLVSFAPLLLYSGGMESRDRSYARYLALFCLLNPITLFFGRDGNVYGALIFTVALFLQQLHRLYFRSDSKFYLTTGAALGLAMSTQYIAAPLGILIPCVHFIKGKGWKEVRWIFYAWGSSLLVFFLLNPFILVDISGFVRTIHSFDAMQQMHHTAFHFLYQLKIAWQFLDPWGLGTVVGLLGIFFGSGKSRKIILSLMLPFLLSLPYLSKALMGAFPRFSIPVHMPFLVIASMGLAAMSSKLFDRPYQRAILALLVFLPSIVRGTSESFARPLEDTRTIAQAWIERNIQPESKILIFDSFSAPHLQMSQKQIQRLYERAKELNNPRKEYFSLLLENNAPGYELFSIKRSDDEIQDTPERIEKSYQSQDVVDPELNGMKEIREKGIGYLIADFYLLNYRSNSPWLSSLMSKQAPIFEIAPKKGLSKGLPLKIYKIVG